MSVDNWSSSIPFGREPAASENHFLLSSCILYVVYRSDSSTSGFSCTTADALRAALVQLLSSSTVFGSAEECSRLSCAFLPAVLKLGLTLQSLAGGRHRVRYRYASKGAEPLVERQAWLSGRHKLQT